MIVNKLKTFYRTAESVSPGHPDSYMDYIVNSILDAYLEQDPNARVAIDGVVKNKFITLGGEITSTAKISDEDIKNIITKCTEDIGYDFKPEITLNLYKQSPDIAQGTNEEVRGAGDQGTITGYAITSKDRIPLEKSVADRLIRKMYYEVRPKYDFIKPDMKSQVTLRYEFGLGENENQIEVNTYIDTVVFACQHTDDAKQEDIEQVVIDAFLEVCKDLEVPLYALDNVKYIVNGTGKFVIGGPEADSGEVGRKIVVDAYGVSVPVGGGTYNGKDPSKVDRSAAYYCRYAAKHIVESGLASEVLITVAYCIGKTEPISIDYDFFNSNRVKEEILVEACNKVFDFTPANMIDFLNLKRPIYKGCTVSHFGEVSRPLISNPEDSIRLPWEEIYENTIQSLTDTVNEIIARESE